MTTYSFKRQNVKIDNCWLIGLAVVCVPFTCESSLLHKYLFKQRDYLCLWIKNLKSTNIKSAFKHSNGKMTRVDRKRTACTFHPKETATAQAFPNWNLTEFSFLLSQTLRPRSDHKSVVALGNWCWFVVDKSFS